MTSTLNETLGSAKHAVAAVKDGAETMTTSARTSVMDGIHMATALYAAARAIGVDDALGWVGLARRRPIRSAVLVGAGVAFGVGVGVLFAPRSGAELRRGLYNLLVGEAWDARHKMENLQEKVTGAVHDAAQVVRSTEQEVASRIGVAKTAAASSGGTAEGSDRSSPFKNASQHDKDKGVNRSS